MNEVVENQFSGIMSRKLSSVEFVLDYMRLGFDGDTVTMITWPTVQKGNVCLRWGESGYRDSICELIGEEVVSADVVKHDTASLIFESGTKIRVSLKPADYIGAEAIMYQSHDGETWFVL